MERIHNLIIVDESGSMEVIRKQAFAGMNETLQTIRKMQEKFPEQEQFVTLLTFDSGHTTWHSATPPGTTTTRRPPVPATWPGETIVPEAARLSTTPSARASRRLMRRLRGAPACSSPSSPTARKTAAKNGR